MIKDFTKKAIGAHLATPRIQRKCGDKLKYSTRKEAHDAKVALKWKKDMNLKLYRCEFCQNWHLGKSTHNLRRIIEPKKLCEKCNRNIRVKRWDYHTQKGCYFVGDERYKMIRFFTFEMFHGKKNVGSTRLRVHNLIKRWPEADLYKYGENPDVLIFQKVYLQPDYKFPLHFEAIKILDICDPDWLIMQNIKETIDAMDGVTCPTETMAEFLRQLTDKPVKVIPDRHETEGTPPPRHHTGKAKKVIWFGYKQNAQLLEFAIPTIEALGLHLTVVSNDDPSAWRWAHDESFKNNYEFKKYDPDEIMQDLRNADICVLPQGNRPVDRFKSDNKTTMAWLAGTPVAVDGDALREYADPIARNEEAQTRYKTAMLEYNVNRSVEDMKAFIEELKEGHSPTAGA